MTMDHLAMLLGYAVIVACAGCSIAFLAGAALRYQWRRLLREVPSMTYIRAAVEHYKTVKPPPKQLSGDEWDCA